MVHLDELAKQALESEGSTAQQAFGDALRRASDIDSIRALAMHFYTDSKVSVPAYERLLELLPGNIEALVDLGFIFFLKGEDDKARRQLDLAQTLAPYGSARFDNLAKQVLEGGGATAQQALRDALSHLYDTSSIRALAGRFYTDPEVSVPVFERLLELSPGNIDYRVDLGLVFFLIGEDDEARRQLGLAQSVDQEHVRVLTLEAALAKEKDTRVRLYRRILQKDPGNEVARDNLKQFGEIP